MRWQQVQVAPCSIARALSVVGERWTLLILREIFFGVGRFDPLRRRLGISRNVLTQRLEHLVDNGVLEKVPYQDRPVRHEYRLTEKGRDLYPVLLALLGWGDRWANAGSPPSLTLTHRTCGHHLTPTTTCAHCGETLDPGSTHARVRAERLAAPPPVTPADS
jgi:DNA-binding HxlR family transcriptional regulator